jgi:hypothetical protein
VLLVKTHRPLPFAVDALDDAVLPAAILSLKALGRLQGFIGSVDLESFAA